MDFKQRHPYLFWQLIGWGLMLADCTFLVYAAMSNLGEWQYPVIVFTFIAALFFVAASPIIVRFVRKRVVPQNESAYTEKLIRGKIFALNSARKIGHPALAAFLVFFSIVFFIFAAFFFGKHVCLALGFAGLVMAIIAPFVIVSVYYTRVTKNFFTVKSAEKLIDFLKPANLADLSEVNLPTLVVRGETDAVLLNFICNWLKYYLKTERLTLYRISAPDLCHDFQPISQLRYEDVLLCIPAEQLDLTNEKETLFNNECAIMGVFPFRNFLVFNEKSNY